MREINLTQGKTTRVSDWRYDELVSHKWYALNCNGHWYAARTVRKEDGSRTMLFMHQQIMGAKWIDHRDGNGLNNEDSNLRTSSPLFNQWNRKLAKNNTTGSTNVNFENSTKRWYARIIIDGKRKRIGGYATREEAEEAVKAKQKLLRGDYIDNESLNPIPLNEALRRA